MHRLLWFHDFAFDVRYAFRSLLRTPAFTAAAVLTVALGIGVNTAVFNVIYTVLLDPLPYRDPGRLVHIAETHPDFPSYQVAAPDLFDWQRLATSFDGVAAYTFQEMNKSLITGDGDPVPVQCVQASAGLFPLLGVKPAIGRFYTDEEERRKAPVVLISESLWRGKYGSDPSIIGRKILLVTFPVTVVGVVPQRQSQPTWAQIWLPLTFLDPALTETRRFHTLEVIGRLKRRASVLQAQAEMSGLASRLAQTYPLTNGKIGVAVLPLSSWSTGEVRAALLIAWAAVSLVLILACVNVGHLVLIRTVHRSREMAMRAALGAGSARITRFLLAENLVLAVSGGMAGAILARAFLPMLTWLAPAGMSRIDAASLSPAALTFGGIATVLCAGLFALPAVFHWRRIDLQQVIKQSSGLSLGHRRSWFGSAIIAAELALAFVILSGAGLLYRSFVALLDENPGFTSSAVLAVEIPLALDWERSAKVFQQKIAPRLREIPGVISVAAANCGPMMLHPAEVSRFSTRFGIAGRTLESRSVPVAQLRWTTPDYFRTLQIPLKRGRLLTDSDIGKPGYVINETLARRYFPGQDPIGQQILTNIDGPRPGNVPIVGVVGDVRDLGLDREPSPTLYELNVSNRMTVLIRGGLKPESLILSVRRALHATSPQAAISTILPLDEIIQESVARRRFALRLLEVFAAVAAMLTAIGVYGVISYSLSRRTTEFAIRFALGAEQNDVRLLVLRKLASPALLGLFAGGWLAYWFASVLRTQLYKLSPADPAVIAISAISLLLLVLVSTLRPVAKATSISASAVLRE